MAGDLISEWTDCDGDRLEWAASYLANKGIISDRRPIGSGRRPIGAKEDAIAWFQEATRSPSHKENLKLMDHAWSQRKSVRGKKNDGKVSLSCYIDKKAKARLESYASKKNLHISEALELVLTRAEIKQGEQLAAVKAKLELLQGKFARYSRALERSTQELADCIIVMQNENSPTSQLNDTQKTLSSSLTRKLLKDFTNGSELAVIDILLSRTMDRP